MCARLTASRADSARMARTVLSLVGPRRQRELVHRLCRASQPPGSVIDVSSATDAVLVLLTQSVDMVLVDAALAGDLIGTLTRHVRRSAPNAVLAIFGCASAQAADTARPIELLPWARLESTLHDFLSAD